MAKDIRKGFLLPVEIVEMLNRSRELLNMKSEVDALIYSIRETNEVLKKRYESKNIISSK